MEVGGDDVDGGDEDEEVEGVELVGGDDDD